MPRVMQACRYCIACHARLHACCNLGYSLLCNRQDLSSARSQARIQVSYPAAQAVRLRCTDRAIRDPSLQSMHGMARRTVACRGFVGGATPAAGAYYCNDFSWQALRDDPGAAHVPGCRSQPCAGIRSPGVATEARSWLEAHTEKGRSPAGHADMHRPPAQAFCSLLTFRKLAMHTAGMQHSSKAASAPGMLDRPELHACNVAGTIEALQRQAAAAKQASPNLSQSAIEGSGQDAGAAVALEEQDAAWETFHARDNATARFYKERRWPVRQVLFPLAHPAVCSTQ